MKKDENGIFIGRCLHKSKGGCWRKTYFVTNEELEKMMSNQNTEIFSELNISQLHPNNTNNTNNTNIPNNPNIHKNENLIKHYLKKEKRHYQNIGRGVHDNIFYVATYVEDEDDHTKTAIITSDRKIFIDFGKDKNEIKKDFGLHYRCDFYWDILDSSWSNQIISKYLYENYQVDIKDLYERIRQTNKERIIYEDERIHSCLAVDVLRSYFFPLFDANSRTHNLAEPGSGKTNQMMIFRALMFNPISSPDFSSASIYRIIEGTGGTILVDDFDDLPEDEKQRLNRHIKVNYKPFKAYRSDGGRKFRPQGYDAYSHLVLNNTIGLEDDITQERVVSYPLLKHKDANTKGVDFKDLVFNSLRDDCYICLLQYWKLVRDSYKTLEIDELKIRDLELFKPLLSIAKIIGDDIFKELLEYAIEYVEQSKLKDLSDDWEYLLFDYIIQMFEKDKISDLKRTLEFPVNDIALDILERLYHNLPPKDKERKLHQLRKFIGGKLAGYQFKKTRPHNHAIYHINAEKLIKILDVKNLLSLFQERLELLGLLGMLAKNSQRKKNSKLEKCFNETTHQKSIDQINDLRKLQNYTEQTSGKNGFVSKKGVLSFIKNGMCKNNPEKYLDQLLKKSILTFYPGKGIKYTGG